MAKDDQEYNPSAEVASIRLSSAFFLDNDRSSFNDLIRFATLRSSESSSISEDVFAIMFSTSSISSSRALISSSMVAAVAYGKNKGMGENMLAN